MAQVVEHLLSKCEALSSNSSITGRKKGGKEGRREGRKGRREGKRKEGGRED
jgi:hypothetical protein